MAVLRIQTWALVTSQLIKLNFITEFKVKVTELPTTARCLLLKAFSGSPFLSPGTARARFSSTESVPFCPKTNKNFHLSRQKFPKWGDSLGLCMEDFLYRTEEAHSHRYCAVLLKAVHRMLTCWSDCSGAPKLPQLTQGPPRSALQFIPGLDTQGSCTATTAKILSRIMHS